MAANFSVGSNGQAGPGGPGPAPDNVSDHELAFLNDFTNASEDYEIDFDSFLNTDE
jgi:hypothetical protein